nr:MAG TPA: hypothetical protein [Caudoviricetes sp.]
MADVGIGFIESVLSTAWQLYHRHRLASFCKLRLQCW